MRYIFASFSSWMIYWLEKWPYLPVWKKIHLPKISDQAPLMLSDLEEMFISLQLLQAIQSFPPVGQIYLQHGIFPFFIYFFIFYLFIYLFFQSKSQNFPVWSFLICLFFPVLNAVLVGDTLAWFIFHCNIAWVTDILIVIIHSSMQHTVPPAHCVTVLQCSRQYRGRIWILQLAATQRKWSMNEAVVCKIVNKNLVTFQCVSDLHSWLSCVQSRPNKASFILYSIYITV